MITDPAKQPVKQIKIKIACFRIGNILDNKTGNNTSVMLKKDDMLHCF